MARLVASWLCLTIVVVVTSGCGETKPKDYIPTTVQQPPSEPPIAIGSGGGSRSVTAPSVKDNRAPPIEAPKKVSQ